jgi:hypothetical protein
MVGTGAGGRAWEQPKGERSDESRRWNGVARGMLGNINHTRSVDIEGLQREGHSRGDGRQNGRLYLNTSGFCMSVCHHQC